MNHNIVIYIALMAITTYLIRMLPLTLIKGDITNPFIKSFLYYVPYATLAAMTFPAIISATSSMISGVIGFAVAMVLAYNRKSLFTVSMIACASVLIIEMILV